jgi:3-hydroxy acid dehydrogenase / malonic semialdehyde reductase
MNENNLTHKTALITGATAGIGKATATMLAGLGCHIIICGRRQERLVEIKQELSQYNVNITTLCFDIRDLNETQNALKEVVNAGLKIDILVNNAGLAAGLSKFYEGDIDDWERMIDTNIKGLLYMSRLIAPEMIKNGSGHIVNVGSIAAKEVYDNGNVYCGTKHMVDALNLAMRRELAEHNIKVSAVHPGAVETEFSIVRFNGNDTKAKAVYDGFENLTAEDIADGIVYMLTRPDRVNINEMTIMPKAQPVASVIHRNKGL